MIALAVIDPDRRLTVTTSTVPEPGPGEVTVDVAYNGVCGSDLHLLFDPPDPLVGHVLGHEFSGVVRATGDGVTGWAPGDRVVVLPIDACGTCQACTNGGDSAVCVTGLAGGPGIGRPGGLAATVAVPAAMLHRVPDGLGLRDAALTEPLAVAMRGVAHAGVQAGDTVVVAGAGPIGLLTVEALHAREIDRILVVEPNPERRARAARFGVDVCSPGDAPAAAARLDDPNVRAVIECTGHPSVVDLGVNLLGYGGRLVVVGVHSAPASVHLLAMSLKEVIVVGSTAYSTADFGAALDALAAGLVDTDALVTSVVGLPDANAKVAELHGGSSSDVKVLITHGLAE
jgi:(R,R)-butanediol dehydrogenase / meso-butanediol dehydrogenase / diacetyl reductase